MTMQAWFTIADLIPGSVSPKYILCPQEHHMNLNVQIIQFTHS